MWFTEIKSCVYDLMAFTVCTVCFKTVLLLAFLSATGITVYTIIVTIMTTFLVRQLENSLARERKQEGTGDFSGRYASDFWNHCVHKKFQVLLQANYF